MFQVAIKSGTDGHHDRLLATVSSNNIPVIGDTLQFGDEKNDNFKKYLVREVERTYTFAQAFSDLEFMEYIRVFVIEV